MKLTVDERRLLRDLMDEHTSLAELNDIAKFDLDVDPDNIAGGTKAGKIREMISYGERHGKVLLLITALVRLYPHVDWPHKAEVVMEPVREQTEEPESGCDITAVSAHLNTIKTLDPMQQFGLANQLLATPTMSNPQSRQNVIGLLPAQIRNSLSPGTTGTLEIINLITTCLNYAGGLSNLLTLIYFVEQESESMKALCQFALTLKNTG